MVVGILFGSVYRGANLIKESKRNRQLDDLISITKAVDQYHEKIARLPGDKDLDGIFDGDEEVWKDLDSEELVNSHIRSPYGGRYTFANAWFAGRKGNFVLVTVPSEVAVFIDRTIDDGDPWYGILRCEDGYWGDQNVDIVHFLPLKGAAESLEGTR
jgi:hypothetical protein